MKHDKKPLFRKENKKAIHYRGDRGDDFKHTRNTKAFKNSEATHMPIKQGVQRGVDYTPLFKFLLSKIGKNWDEVYSEAKSRLDKTEPIFWMVNVKEKSEHPTVRLGESTYFSSLFVDENNTLQKCFPEFSINEMRFRCDCCTYTFNGKVITNKSNHWLDK